MPSSQQLSCSSLLPTYRALGSGIEVAQKALKVFEQENDETSRQALQKALTQAGQAKTELLAQAHAQVEYRGKSIRTIEALALETMGKMLGQDPLFLFEANGRVTNINVISFTSDRITDAISLIPAFDTLTTLYCSRTSISELPKLPNTLTELDCSEASISELPKLPNTLTVLWCSDTSISELPELPDTLTELNCSDTSISKLPKLPNTLTELHCSDTPAAQNPKEIKKIEAFKQAHPNADVSY